MISFRHTTVKTSLFALLACLATPASAQDNLKEVPSSDPQYELDRLNVAEGYALNLFGVEPEDLYAGVHAVGNSLNSLVGYQTKGYALVPMN